MDIEGKENSPRNGGSKMQIHAKQIDTDNLDHEVNDELADVLTAISVVSRRLARKLILLSEQEKKKGENLNGQNE